MKYKERLNLYRTLAVAVMALVTFGVTALLSAGSHFYTDEWLCLFFVDLIFLFIYVFELEYERRQGVLANNTRSNFMRIAGMYTACAILAFGMSYLPEFSKPVILIPLLMCAVSNMALALSTGLFFDILLALISGGNFHALLALVLLTLLGAVLSEALKERAYRLPIALNMFFLNLMLPGIFYYWSYKEITVSCFLYGAGNGIITAFGAYMIFGKVWRESEKEMDNQYLDIVTEDYSEVVALKDYSMQEYRHAKRVSDIAYRCGQVVGCNPNLCLAAGFYYRMGRWLGEPYGRNMRKKAEQLCFPDRLTQILCEYYGEAQRPSSPESALVHMVDALAIKLEVMDKTMGDSQWNRDILIYQTLNEFSASGLYDHSGMSMNQFLKAREFLAKEEMLQ
ncbi:MAG: hypothetical protein NC355_06585 [Blautia sp.]|nr:hypothetical protein [Blautia sp.]